MINFLSIIASVISAVAPAVPYNQNYVNIVYASPKTTLDNSVLFVDKVPETTETEPALKIAQGEKEGEKVANHEEEGKSSPSEATASIPAVLARIAFCESGNRHFDENGQVLRGKENPNDIGKYQINLLFHLETSQKMGLDIFKEEDNKKYALYLYGKNGERDWLASKSCWK